MHSADKQQGAILLRRSSLLQYACKQTARHFAQDPDRLRILCWTNKQVDYYNQQIRQHLYGKTAPRFVVNERLIARDLIYAPDGKTCLVQTSTEFTVRETHKDRYANYCAWRLVIELDDGSKKQIYALAILPLSDEELVREGDSLGTLDLMIFVECIFYDD